jgi:type I restriction-modification system DNA methylase subunit
MDTNTITVPTPPPPTTFNSILQHDVEQSVDAQLSQNYKVPTNKTLWTIPDNTEENNKYKEEKAKIESVIKQCHNLLYNTCSIVGTKAQNDIMRLMCLRILKAQFNDDTSELWAACVAVKADQNLSDTKFNKYMKYCKDMKTLTHPDLDFFKEWCFLVHEFLIYALPSVYGEEDDRFNCDNYTVCIKMIKKMENDLPASKAFSDAFSTTCGDIHEVFRAYGGKVAKEQGQFFTTRELIHATFHGGLDLAALLHNNHGATVYDPCMGTGGFLTRMFNLFEVDPDNIYGCETEADTIKFGQMSLVLTTGKVGNNIVKCNSISENPLLVGTKKMDAIVTNPPFGTKMKYADLKKTFEETFSDTPVKFEDIYPIKTSNGACLFIQHCVYMLAEGGVCAIVLPDGELFDSHSKWSTKFREWWCENVNIRTILKVPAGVFKHAGVRTNVVVFTKDGPTTSIDYKELTDKTCTRINELFSVDIADIVQMGYNLDYKAYLKEESVLYGVPTVALGEICTLENGTLTDREVEEDPEGEARMITLSNDHSRYKNISSYKRDGSFLFIGNVGRGQEFALNYYEGKCDWTRNVSWCKLDESKVLPKFLYYFLWTQQKVLTRDYLKGVANLSLNKLKFLAYKIPLFPIQTQQRIINEFEAIEATIQREEENIKDLQKKKTGLSALFCGVTD